MRFRVALAITVVLVVACEGSAREGADPCGDLDALITEAVRQRKSGLNEEARALYLTTLETALAKACRLQEARIWNNLGTLVMVEGRLTESLRHFERAQVALSAFAPASAEESQRAQELEAKLEVTRGGAYLRLGWLEDARGALREVRNIYRSSAATPEEWATVLLFTARVNRLEGEMRAAEDSVQEGLELANVHPQTRSGLFVEQARLALEDGRFQEADRSLARAEEILEKLGNLINEANVISDRAELYLRQGRDAESLRWTEKALDLAREAKTPDLNLEAHALYLKSVALWKVGEPKRSRRAADAALALLEGTRDAWHDLGIEYLARRQSYYRHRLDLAARTGTPDDAWNVFEGYRAQGLLETASLRAGDSSRAPDLEAREGITSRRTELLAAARDLDALAPNAPDDLVGSRESRFRDRRRALRELQAEQIGPSSQRPEIGAETAAGLLDPETLALVFAAGVEKIYVLALDRRNALQVHSLDGDAAQVEEWNLDVLKGLDPYGDSQARRRLDRNVDELSHALLGPLASRLDRYRRLVIIADGPVERLPFEVLRHPKSGQRLVQSHEVAYLASFSVLAATRERTCPIPELGLFALGDPIFGSHDDRWTGAGDPRHADEALAFRRLPASAAEVEAIGGLYAPDATRVLGREATRERMLAEASRHQVLHLASHARSHQQAPERSRIALSCLDSEGRVPETCDLYFEDVAALELCGQLVVLSACETAGGRPVAGEGILGLPWAFLRAGAATVVASLWRVADEPTAGLMKAFHRHLRRGAGPAAALRQAKLEMIDAGRPPSEWGAFVLLGDWRSATATSTFSPPSGPND